MVMNSTTISKPPILALGSIVMAAVILSCQTSGSSGRRPAIIPPDRQIALMDGGPNTGRTHISGAAVEYQYTLNAAAPPDASLSIQGRTIIAPGELSQVNIYLLVLDGQGKVLGKEVLYTSGYNNRYASNTPVFKKSCNLSPGTMAIAFDSYIRIRRGDR